jgi:hypothetical protein
MWMGLNELAHRRAAVSAGDLGRAEEAKKLFASAHGEERRRVRDDVRVHAPRCARELKTNREPARLALWRGVRLDRDQECVRRMLLMAHQSRQARRAREARSYGRARCGKVWRRREFARLRGRCEDSGQQHTFRMC